MFILGNYFKTKEEAEKVVEKMQIYTKLKRLAERLNDGEKIDWSKNYREKYCIVYDYEDETFDMNSSYCVPYQGTIYCLDAEFLNVALEEIGEDKLRKLFE